MRLLHSVYGGRHKTLYHNSLASSGAATGTMRNRLKHTSVRGRVRAKTGTIPSRGIKVLSGYATDSTNEVYAFSVLVNGARDGAQWQARVLADAICCAILGVSENALKN